MYVCVYVSVSVYLFVYVRKGMRACVRLSVLECPWDEVPLMCVRARVHKYTSLYERACVRKVCMRACAKCVCVRMCTFVCFCDRDYACQPRHTHTHAKTSSSAEKGRQQQQTPQKLQLELAPLTLARQRFEGGPWRLRRGRSQILRSWRRRASRPGSQKASDGRRGRPRKYHRRHQMPCQRHRRCLPRWWAGA